MCELLKLSQNFKKINSKIHQFIRYFSSILNGIHALFLSLVPSFVIDLRLLMLNDPGILYDEFDREKMGEQCSPRIKLLFFVVYLPFHAIFPKF